MYVTEAYRVDTDLLRSDSELRHQGLISSNINLYGDPIDEQCMLR